MAKTLAALETEVRSHLDALPPRARARWTTLRVLRGAARAFIFALAIGASGAACLMSGVPVIGLGATALFMSLGYAADRVVCGFISLVAVRGAVRALEQAHGLGSVGGTASVALPPPMRSTHDRNRKYPAPRPKKVRVEGGDREARDFDDAG
ncbi:MAG: hypothetical protein IT383_14605 [Deltaproteobacteria bacterium]|nr:hypothetical protein [Deltaproteobacteria bacterium]